MESLVVETPESLDELVECLKRADKNTYLLAGGTDLIIRMRRSKIYSGKVIDLSGINELKKIKEESKYLRIGALVTHSMISENDKIKEFFPALMEASSQVGSTQIRNRGTIAGNIANSSPCADTVPPLMTSSAKVRTINGKGEIKERDIDEVVKGSGFNYLQKDEAIIEIIIPKLGNEYLSAFGKLGSRTAVTIAKINGAILVKMDSTGKKIKKAYVSLGALGPKAFRSKIVEDRLIGKEISRQLFHDLCNSLIEQVDLAIKGRSSHPYKREAIKGMAQDIFIRLFGSGVLENEKK
ncbi:FAD binding domain-containing protein [Thermohalobacter berrensis]|uniref:FAD-binding PCMH-type domain-containing protein n=1 Tax=Thermohalobacter berrensis TaxID=99594 RepID=A0A419T695_9FIRM|nr:FAD binding domain-containing protein [Thermohalobacter berrensis]RKD32939.1 hypothetical protein BET03_09995 [Thermohalobacter berrensis]